MPQCPQEGECHSASHENAVDGCEEIPDHGELVRHLGAAHHHDIGTGRVVQDPRETRALLGDEQPLRMREQPGDVRDGGLLSVDHPESIADERVRESGPLSGQRCPIRVVLACLARVETHVLEEDDVAVAHARHCLGDFRPRDCRDERHGASEQVGEPRGHRLEGEAGDGLPPGPAEVRQHHDSGTSRGEGLQGGDAGPDPSVIGDGNAAVRQGAQRHVQVGAHEHDPTPHGEVVERSDHRRTPTYWVRSMSLLEYPHSLSYQPSTLTMVPMELVMPASKITDAGSVTMSVETIGSSV